MYEVFIALQKFVNSKGIMTLYYEEAEKKAVFPYGVISDPVETCLNYGNLIYFDINIWSIDPITGVELEKKIQELITLLDCKIFADQKAIIYYETQKPITDPEFELIKKQVTFSIRSF